MVQPNTGATATDRPRIAIVTILFSSIAISFGDAVVKLGKTISVREWIVIVVLAFAITVGNIGTSLAYQVGRSSVVATFSFSYVPYRHRLGFYPVRRASCLNDSSRYHIDLRGWKPGSAAMI